MSKDNFEYVIVGDTKEYEGCLIYCCGNSKEATKKTLNEVLSEKRYTDEFTNIRIETVPKEDCWWNNKLNF